MKSKRIHWKITIQSVGRICKSPRHVPRDYITRLQIRSVLSQFIIIRHNIFFDTISRLPSMLPHSIPPFPRNLFDQTPPNLPPKPSSLKPSPRTKAQSRERRRKKEGERERKENLEKHADLQHLVTIVSTHLSATMEIRTEKRGGASGAREDRLGQFGGTVGTVTLVEGFSTP